MKTLLDFLGFGSSATPRDEDGDTATVRKIVRRLEALEPERARFVAAFAFILGRVANADLEISREESRKMEEIVAEVGALPSEQALLVVEIAKGQHRLAGGTESYLVTREFAQLAGRRECEQLLDCLFAVSAADESISSAEEAQVRQVAEELGFSDNDFLAIRARWTEKRSVIQRMRRKAKG